MKTKEFVSQAAAKALQLHNALQGYAQNPKMNNKARLQLTGRDAALFSMEIHKILNQAISTATDLH